MRSYSNTSAEQTKDRPIRRNCADCGKLHNSASRHRIFIAVSIHFATTVADSKQGKMSGRPPPLPTLLLLSGLLVCLHTASAIHGEKVLSRVRGGPAPVTKDEKVLELLFGSEGGCQNGASDNGNWLNKRLGYTCMGITPGTGFKSASAWPHCAACKTDPTLFVKCCFDLDHAKFKAGAAQVYRTQYFSNCKTVPWPAYYICCDMYVNGGGYVIMKTPKQADPKQYCLALNAAAKAYYKQIGVGKQAVHLAGWLNRANSRDLVCKNPPVVTDVVPPVPPVTPPTPKPTIQPVVRPTPGMPIEDEWTKNHYQMPIGY